MSVQPADKRLEDIKDNILENLKLLKAYEDKLRLSVDPIEKNHCEHKIADQRSLLKIYEEEKIKLEENISIVNKEPLIKISLAKLPSTNPELFGREKELKMLDEAWGNPKTNIVSLLAWGGVGKTALVSAWLNRIARDNYRGAERVFGWSFYSQGAAENKQTSSDDFIAYALVWFGDENPTNGLPWEKGVRLAGLIKKQRTLLILDGLEPFTEPTRRGARSYQGSES